MAFPQGQYQRLLAYLFLCDVRLRGNQPIEADGQAALAQGLDLRVLVHWVQGDPYLGVGAGEPLEHLGHQVQDRRAEYADGQAASLQGRGWR